MEETALGLSQPAAIVSLSPLVPTRMEETLAGNALISGQAFRHARSTVLSSPSI